MKNILRGKSRKQILNDFVTVYWTPRGQTNEDVSDYDFKKAAKKFAWGMRRPTKKIWSWTWSIFLWVFCLSWMIQAGIAMDGKFFWWPVDPEVQSMFGFVNIFWAIIWYAVPTALIVYQIIRLITIYDKSNDSY